MKVTNYLLTSNYIHISQHLNGKRVRTYFYELSFQTSPIIDPNVGIICTDGNLKTITKCFRNSDFSTSDRHKTITPNLILKRKYQKLKPYF